MKGPFAGVHSCYLFSSLNLPEKLDSTKAISPSCLHCRSRRRVCEVSQGFSVPAASSVSSFCQNKRFLTMFCYSILVVLTESEFIRHDPESSFWPTSALNNRAFAKPASSRGRISGALLDTSDLAGTDVEMGEVLLNRDEPLWVVKYVRGSNFLGQQYWVA